MPDPLPERPDLDDYLKHDDIIDHDDPLIEEAAEQITEGLRDNISKAQAIYEFDNKAESDKQKRADYSALQSFLKYRNSQLIKRDFGEKSSIYPANYFSGPQWFRIS